MKKIFFLTLIASLAATDALATTALKQVQVSNGSQVDLLFDGKVSRNQIKTEFFNDIIQISLTDVSVYPAKISSVNGGNLTKIFAYQYAPKLVRCRLSVKGKAESYKDKISVVPGGPNGKVLTVRLNGANVAVQKTGDDAEEAALLERVIKSSAPAAAPAAAALPERISDRIVEKAAAPIQAAGVSSMANSPASSEDQPLSLGRSENHNLTSSKTNIPSPLGVFGKLALVVGLFSILAMGVKKFWKGKGTDNALFGVIGKLARTGLGVKGLGNKAAIEILANHHLGPKKSIAVVRVAGRTMVVGITEQSINLISQLTSEEDTLNAIVEFDNPPLDDIGPMLKPAAKPSTGATAAGPAVFAQAITVGSSRVDLQACKLEYSIVSPK